MDLWTQVQQRLEVNRQGHKTQVKAKNPSPLSGKLFDETGRRLIPSHTRKANKRYRYYVTPTDDPGEPIRLPADDLEQLIVQAIVNWSSNDKEVLNAVGWKDAKRAANALNEAKQLATVLQHKPKTELASRVARVEVTPSLVRIWLDLASFGLRKDGTGPKEAIIEVAAERKRSGMAVRLVISDQRPGKLHVRPPDPTLVSLMTKGKAWLQQFTQGGQAIETIAEREKLSSRYVNRVINVALLAPDIVQAIERGDHPGVLIYFQSWAISRRVHVEI